MVDFNLGEFLYNLLDPSSRAISSIMPFHSISPDARRSEPSVDSSLDDDLTSSDELASPIPPSNASLTRSARPGSGRATPPNSSTPRTPRRGHGILKGTGSELQPGSARRARAPAVSYNIKELSRKTRVPSKPTPKRPSLDARTTNAVLPDSRRHRSEPPTYNLQEMIRQTRFTSKPTRRAAKQLLKKERTRQGPASKRAVGGRGAEDHPPAKRQRLDQDTSGVPDVVDVVRDLGRNSSASAEVSKLIEYITPILRNGEISNPRLALASTVFNSGLLSLPQQRAVEWNPGRANQWKFRANIDITALLMQVTGDLAPSTCTKCRQGHGLFTSCILLSSKTDPGNIYGCANCVYHGRQTFCSYKTWNREASTKKSSKAHGPKHKTQAVEYNQDIFRGESGAEESDSSTDDIARPNGAGQSPVPHGQASGTGTRSRAHDRRAATEEAKPRSRANDASLVTAGRPAELLSMEPWERAPGQICSNVSGRVGSIAFSKSYLAAGHEIQACREAAFRIEVIRSGHNHRLKPQDGVTRLCSIAAGKLKVHMSSEEPFIIGPHGMFRITPGSACLVESEVYDDVVLHITSIQTEDD